MASLQRARSTVRYISCAISGHSRAPSTLNGQRRFLCLSNKPSSQLAFVSSEYDEIYKRSIKDPSTFWKEQASSRLQWIKPFTKVMDCDMNIGQHRWFMDGQLNVSGLLQHLVIAGELLAPPCCQVVIMNVSIVQGFAKCCGQELKFTQQIFCLIPVRKLFGQTC